MGEGKLSKTENIKLKEKIKLFNFFQGGTKSTRVSVNFIESISNECVAGNSQIEQADSRGPMGVDHHKRVESRSSPCGQGQEMETVEISEIEP